LYFIYLSVICRRIFPRFPCSSRVRFGAGELEHGMATVGFAEWMALGRVIASGQLARYGGQKPGPLVKFEHDFAEKFGVKHSLAVGNGTGALICSLVAAGVGPGDEVLVPAYTWIATAAAPLAVGAVPVLVDVDETLT